MLPRAILLTGVPDDTIVRARLGSEGAVEIIWPGTGCFAGELAGAVAERVELALPIPRTLTIDVPRFPVFNHMADPDRYAHALAGAVEIVRLLDVPCFNHPAAVLRTGRDTVSRSLADLADLVVPRTIRISPRCPDDIRRAITEAEMTYPVIMRVTGTQSAQTQVLIRSPNDEDAIHSVPWGGCSVYITQYIEYKTFDGWFRKARICWIGEHIFPVHHMSSHNWAVNGANADSDQDHFESDWMQNFRGSTLTRYRGVFEEIRSRIDLDIFMMDCSFLLDGRILIFEVTASGAVLRSGWRGAVPTIVAEGLTERIKIFQQVAANPASWRSNGRREENLPRATTPA